MFHVFMAPERQGARSDCALRVRTRTGWSCRTSAHAFPVRVVDSGTMVTAPGLLLERKATNHVQRQPMDVSPFFFDTRRDPLLVLEWAESYSTEQLVNALDEVTRYLDNHARTPFALLADVTRRKDSTVSNRTALTNFVKRNEASIKAQCVGWAVVHQSKLVQGALTAIFWFKAPEWEMKSFTTRADAEAWLAERIRVGKVKHGT